MKYYLLFILFIFLLSSCRKGDDINRIIPNTALRNCLDQIINHEDSMKNVFSTYGDIKSYTITFAHDISGCYVLLVADFENYDSETMIGYFNYKSKIVSIYGLSNSCWPSFINIKKLKKGPIVGLTDYNPNAFYVYTKQHLPVPPPPSLGEPYFRKYLILSSDSLRKVEDRDDIERNFRENKYLK